MEALVLVTDAFAFIVASLSFRKSTSVSRIDASVTAIVVKFSSVAGVVEVVVDVNVDVDVFPGVDSFAFAVSEAGAGALPEFDADTFLVALELVLLLFVFFLVADVGVVAGADGCVGFDVGLGLGFEALARVLAEPDDFDVVVELVVLLLVPVVVVVVVVVAIDLDIDVAVDSLDGAGVGAAVFVVVIAACDAAGLDTDADADADAATVVPDDGERFLFLLGDTRPLVTVVAVVVAFFAVVVEPLPTACALGFGVVEVGLEGGLGLGGSAARALATTSGLLGGVSGTAQ